MSSTDQSIRLAPATADDVGLILWFIKQLAAYEKAPEQVTATEDLLRQTLFGPRPYAEVILAYASDGAAEKPAGFALFFHNYSTWVGRPGLYLEDLFVCPEFRGRGVGKRLLVQLAQIARERQCGRMEWVVLDWNEPSIQFYLSLGAQQMKEWIIHRVSGRALESLSQL
ncbi:acetyltransferase [Coemansia sp. RSA 989]|nr:acetyltransferase [Coemansia sp. RSA 1086]KAJ1752439.1 acetyltransferase [Coemansia sp. RSA 1821]KAJ1862703.1 acetyltransferase [Coemansia sp. RSA 989]KAJ1874571.1 acetyltransferase [Coemansia sp. RSA 990]KAJ2626968.1 Peroxygenase 1 [Coemansia sp. RSA 1290]KAJ2648584.1 acetyltransferase [Coemansia sp. RSA 1250]KAJ2673283.1 acetyltransferase [Coemansia sp. RSA 1085]